MKIIIFLLLASFSGLSTSSEVSAVDLLKRDLGERIDVISKYEIHFCPDNTCEIYKIKTYNKNFEKYIYLDIYHNSKNIFITEKYAGEKAFKLLAKEEPEIRNSVKNYCQSQIKTPACVINGMKEKLKIKKCFGRYDEGHFCYGCEKNENICKKL